MMLPSHLEGQGMAPEIIATGWLASGATAWRSQSLLNLGYFLLLMGGQGAIEGQRMKEGGLLLLTRKILPHISQ